MNQETNFQYLNDDSEKNRKTNALIIIAAVLGLFLVGAVIFAVVNNKKQTQANQKLASENLNLTSSIATRDSLMNDMMGTFEQIENDLNMVKQKQNMVTVQTNDPEFRQDRKQAILKDIQMMNSLLEDSKNRIAALSRKLKESGIKMKEMEDKIASLNTLLEARDADINDLKRYLEEKDFKLAELNKNLDSVQVAHAKSQEIIRQQESELNKAFFVYGTYKDLKAKGLLTKDGGFLKLGQKTELRDSMNEKLFTRIDINETKTFPIHAKKAHLVTDHPKNSYTYVQENGEIAYLEIRNPQEFWKISKYAVVEVK